MNSHDASTPHPLDRTHDVMVAIYDLHESRFDYANQATERFTGHDSATLRDAKNTVRLQRSHPDDQHLIRGYFPDTIADHMGTRQGEAVTVRIKNAGGEYRWVHQYVTIFERNTDGTPQKILIVSADVTDSLTDEAIQQLFSSSAPAVDEPATSRPLNHLREGLVNHINHEFRTPLTIINSSAEFLDRYFDDLTAERRLTHVQRIRQQVGRILTMYDSVYDYYRWRRYLSADEYYLCDMLVICNNAAAVIKNRVDPALDLQIQATTEQVQLESYAVLVEMVVLALLQNAAQASLAQDEHAIGVGLFANNQNVTLTVMDRGVGIHPDDKANVYKPFFRGRDVRSVPGLGLGLALVDQVLRAIGGEIYMHSTQGHGTTVTVHLPLVAQSTNA